MWRPPPPPERGGLRGGDIAAQPQQGAGPAAGGGGGGERADDQTLAEQPGGDQGPALGHPGGKQPVGAWPGPRPGHHYDVVAVEFRPACVGTGADAVRPGSHPGGLGRDLARPRGRADPRAPVAQQAQCAPPGGLVVTEDGDTRGAEAGEALRRAVGVVVDIGDLGCEPLRHLVRYRPGPGGFLRHVAGELPLVQSLDQFRRHRPLPRSEARADVGEPVVAYQVRDDEGGEAVGGATGQVEPAVGVVEEHSAGGLGEQHVPADARPGRGERVERRGRCGPGTHGTNGTRGSLGSLGHGVTPSLCGGCVPGRFFVRRRGAVHGCGTGPAGRPPAVRRRPAAPVPLR